MEETRLRRETAVGPAKGPWWYSSGSPAEHRQIGTTAHISARRDRVATAGVLQRCLETSDTYLFDWGLHRTPPIGESTTETRIRPLLAFMLQGRPDLSPFFACQALALAQAARLRDQALSSARHIETKHAISSLGF